MPHGLFPDLIGPDLALFGIVDDKKEHPLKQQCPTSMFACKYNVLSHGYVIFLLFFTIEHIPMSVMTASFMSRPYICVTWNKCETWIL